MLKTTPSRKRPKTTPGVGTIQRESRQAEIDPLRSLLHLQQTIGNKAVERLIRAKLKNGRPEQRYERQADRVAEAVMRMPKTHKEQMIQRQAAQYSRFSVSNPGDAHWTLLSSNRQPRVLAYSAGAIVRGTRPSDYDGWQPMNRCDGLTMRDNSTGAEVQIRSGAQVAGVLRSGGVGTYVKDAWVEATVTNASGFIDAEVGWSRPFKWVTAKWDFDFNCAVLHLPIEVRIYHGRGTTVLQNTLSYYGCQLCSFGRTP